MVNGSPVAGSGNLTTPHVHPNSPPHVGVLIGTSKLMVNGTPIAMVGDPTSCGAVIVSGDATMNIT